MSELLSAADEAAAMVDAGDPDHSSTHDMAGTARGSSPDAGAHEL